MSHAATKWAIEQRGLRPAAKIVLWHLCDRYHPDNGCFPSQDRLADDCEMSRSALNDHLKSLEEACKIKRDQRRDPRTRKIISTQYHFPFENGFVATPCPEIGQGTVSENMPEPSPENADSRVRNPDTNLVIEPVIEPRERDAREGEQEDHVPDQPLLDQLIAGHPQSAHDRLSEIEKAWRALSREDRRLAVEALPAWLSPSIRGKRTALAGLPIYLGDRMFARVNVPSLAAGDSPYFPPFSKLWYAAFCEEVDHWGDMLLDRHSAETAYLRGRVERAKRYRIGWKIESTDRRALIEERAKAFVQIHKESAEGKEWAEWFKGKGVDLPIPDAVPYLFLPSERPPNAGADPPSLAEMDEVLG